MRRKAQEKKGRDVRMKVRRNDKGFSLVELIIVIAIMLVLVGILAPQFVKYVRRSRVAADVANAQAIADAINVAIADGTPFTGFVNGGETFKNTEVTGLPGITKVPASRIDSELRWIVNWTDEGGVWEIKLGAHIIYPDATNFREAHNSW